MQRIEKFDVLMKKFEENQNKEDKPYPCFVSDETAKGRETQKCKVKNKKHHDRRKNIGTQGVQELFFVNYKSRR